MRVVLLLTACLAVSCSPAHRHGGLPCDFGPAQEAEDHVAECADRQADGSIIVRPEALTKAYFSPEGVADVVVAGETYFVSRTGRTVRALPFDNGSDYFVEGLARTVRGGKVGFVNAELVEVIAPQWDFAFPFENGFAKVCQGCVSKPVGDEHSEVVGGTWGYIDKSGAVVVPVTHERDSLPAPDAVAPPADTAPQPKGDD